MPSGYHIKIVNNTTDPTPYLLFCDPPDTSNNTEKAWVNIYGTTPVVAPMGGSTSLNIDNSNYAVCGMAEQPLGPGVSVSTSQTTPVALGPGQYGKVLMDIVGGGLMFTGETEKTNTVCGYEMDSKSWTNDQYPQAFCGYGKLQPNMPAGVIPVATWTARSDKAYKVYPKVRYFISTGGYQPGDIIDVSALVQIATVDFSGRNETFAIVVQDKNGTYLPTTYSFS